MSSNTLAFIGGMGMPEMFMILAVVLILFGAKKVPELARGMGQGIKEFKKASQDVRNDLEEAIHAPVEPHAPAAKSDSETSAV